MSGTPNKRLHEDSGGHPSISRYSNMQDDSGTYPSSMGGTKEYHPPSFDIGQQDARVPKVPRTETREADSRRRSPLLQMYRVQPPSMGDPQSDHAEDRVEPRDSSGRDIKIEGQDVKIESKELYQGAKGDKDVRYVSRVLDDHKETLYYRSELKTDKDAYNNAVNSHPIWKDHHRANKYPDTSGGNSNAPHVWSSSTVHGSAETARESLTKEEKDSAEVQEAVGENKVDAKGEDRLKDKDRKRKDSKHQEWGECNNLQACNPNDNLKDQMKDDREADKLEKERKDKDKLREREKDHAKRESWIGNDKDGFQNEKEATDASSRSLEQENSLDLKKQKIPDGWKDFDKESKDRRRERDIDVEVDRSERRTKVFDKDSDDGGLDVEGSADRDREGLNYGVQQRKRMLRPRGSPQVTNRDPRFRSHTRDNDGSTGNPDVLTVIYRVGECMQELIKLWKDYKSSVPDKISESSQSGPTLEIHIPAEHISATNRQVKGGQLWGTDIYTYDSDLVAVLMHAGYCRPTASPPPPAIQELHATVRVLRPQECYISTLRNNVRSRAWGAPVGCSFRVERCCILKKGGGMIDLEPCLTHTSTVEPTLAPVVVERTMTTRAAASNALRQQRFVREVTLQYNLCNEPWIKYSISAIADKGLKKPLFTSARLKRGEVLYLESRSCRYELCYNGEKMVKAVPTAHANNMETEKYQNQGLHLANGDRSTDSDSILMDVFRWSRCKKPLPQKMMRSIGMPLPLEHLEVLEYNLDWEEIQWSQTGVWISGKEYPLSRVHFLSPA